MMRRDIVAGRCSGSSCGNRICVVITAGVPTVAVALRGPYDLAGLPESVWTLAAFEYTEQSIRAVARVLRGEAEPTGRLPVTL